MFVVGAGVRRGRSGFGLELDERSVRFCSTTGMVSGGAGGKGTAGRTRLGEYVLKSGVFIEPLWRDTDIFGVGKVDAAVGSIDDGGYSVPARFARRRPSGER